MKHTRHRFFVGCSAAVAAAASVRPPARAAQYEYKLGNADPIEHPINVRLIEWGKAVEAETNGRMKITVFPHNQLGNQSSLFQQLRQGSIQFFATLNGVYASVVPVSAIDSVGFAFTSPQQPAKVMDGALGAYVRREFLAKNIFVFDRIWEHGMRQTTTSTHPIRTAADWANLKIRTPPAKIYVDLFTTLGASPTPLDSSETYTALQTRLIDAEESPLSTILTEHFYEVSRYLSITNHQWAGYWLVANGDAWNALPPDIRAIVERNATKYSLLERADVYRYDIAAIEKLRRQGLAVNDADSASMRAKLAPYYARWKNELGATAWSLLEASVGKLG